MFLAGLWHGAGWNYVVWGLLHGVYLAGQNRLSKPYQRLCEYLRCPKVVADGVAMLVVFVLTRVGWVFFRARSIEKAFYMLKAIVWWPATAHLSFGGMKFQLMRVSLVAAIDLLVELSPRRAIGFGPG